MRSLFATFLLLACSASAYSEPKPKLRLATETALVSLAAVDGWQTVSCVQSTHCQELNPVYKPVAGSPAGMVAAKAAITTGIIVGARQLHKRGYKKAGWALLLSGVASQALVVTLNARTIQR